MPTYDYECSKCDRVFEVFQSITAPKLTACPECGSEVRRLPGTGAGLVLKGTGWYVTDFKNKAPATSPSKKKEGAADKPAAEKSASKPDSSGTKDSGTKTDTPG